MNSDQTDLLSTTYHLDNSHSNVGSSTQAARKRTPIAGRCGSSIRVDGSSLLFCPSAFNYHSFSYSSTDTTCFPGVDHVPRGLKARKRWVHSEFTGSALTACTEDEVQAKGPN